MLAMMLAQYEEGAAGAGVAAAIWACWCGAMVVGLLLFAFWVWMLIDCIMRKDEEFPEGQTKVLWLLLLIFLSYISMIFYYFMVKKKIPRAA